MGKTVCYSRVLPDVLEKTQHETQQSFDGRRQRAHQLVWRAPDDRPGGGRRSAHLGRHRVRPGGFHWPQAEPAGVRPAAPERRHRGAERGLQEGCAGAHVGDREPGRGEAQRLREAEREDLPRDRAGEPFAVAFPVAVRLAEGPLSARYTFPRGVEQRQLVGLITRRSLVRIQAPQPTNRIQKGATAAPFLVIPVFSAYRMLTWL